MSQVVAPSRYRQREEAMVEMFQRHHRPLFPELGSADEGMLTTVWKADNIESDPSKQGVGTGRKSKPFNFKAAAELKVHNPHHSACLDAKTISTVGLGHVKPATSRTLNRLCGISWSHTLAQLAEDFFTTGNGFLEVVRREPKSDSPITGLHWIPATDVWIHIENGLYQMHYEVFDRGSSLPNTISARGEVGKKYAKFGDLDSFLERHKISETDAKRVSEVIHFPNATSASRFYGVPGWLSAISYIELAQAMVQHQFDFHLNRGVPEFMLFILGTKLRKGDWDKVKGSMRAQIGLGNTHKSIALNLSNPEVKIQVEKLAMEASQDGDFFRNMLESLAMNIVSAHRVPPSLAQILIPGKMGAANESSNAIIMFQSLVVGPSQNLFETVLDCTLGDPQRNGGLQLSEGDFELKTVVDELAEMMAKLQPMDTMGRMRDEMPQAASEGRALEDGLQKEAWSYQTTVRFLSDIVRKGLDPVAA